jgi:hypothetical protein
MAFDFSFDCNKQTVYIKASVDIDFGSTLEAMKTLLSDDQFSKDMGILVDIRDVDYAPSLAEVFKILQSPLWRAIVGEHRIAVVAGKPVQFGMTNVLARRSGDAANMEPFYKLEDAVRWLACGHVDDIGLGRHLANGDVVLPNAVLPNSQ